MDPRDGNPNPGPQTLVSTGSASAAPAVADADSRRWVEQLAPGHRHHDRAVAKLHDVLLRVAISELLRRRRSLGLITGPELDDLAHQAADDALLNILAKRNEFLGLSRFTTWACKFVIFEVSTKVAQHAWRRERPMLKELAWQRLPDLLAPEPGDRVEQRERLQALSAAIRKLTDRQREVFVAIVLQDVPSDVLAIRLGSNRNAIYKNLFDARRNLRASMAAAGHPVTEKNGVG